MSIRPNRLISLGLFSQKRISAGLSLLLWERLSRNQLDSQTIRSDSRCRPAGTEPVEMWGKRAAAVGCEPGNAPRLYVGGSGSLYQAKQMITGSGGRER